MDWENVPENIEGLFGFIYKIERINALPGERRFYWGCKQFHRNFKRPALKGKSRKRKASKESDWKSYYGSSNDLKNDVAIHGKENFKRTILKVCSCKWQLKYEELITQIENRAILREDSYNGILNLRIGKVPKDLKAYYN